MEFANRFMRLSAVSLRSSRRTFCSSRPRNQQHGQENVRTQHHEILIIGGGTAGAAVASRLASSTDARKITVVEPSELHYYQPLWTLVGAGISPMKNSVIPMRKALPNSINVIQDKLVRLEPESSIVHLADGTKLTYGNLVLALGMEVRYDLIPGALEALDSDARVISNYSSKYVEKTYPAFQAFQGGRALFTLPTGQIKCAGAPQKVMYLFEDYLKRGGKRDLADIHYFTALPKMFSVDKYSEKLVILCRERNIHFHLQHHLVDVNSAKSEATFVNLTTKEPKIMQYDMLHITPPMTVPDVLKNTPKLTDPMSENYVNVDAGTLQHNVFPNIWALGDCAALPTSKTAAAVSSQAAVLCTNLRSVINGGKADLAQYDGYTACPLVTGYNRGILAEFDYSKQPLETLPLDQSKERYIHYFLKAHVMPAIYWDWLIKGLWPGPKHVRKLLHLGFSK
ncbi:FAD-dependent pyridine nucleotide-disulfide oxidoreductase [Paragonimus heterotremus]|uniref:Sulfide:quinone oxidoreductase, mitochondrial n=1 Tax=Paragonimus heterotremus TaxID=100268 RepID=A0A8J4SYS8_9TREM|nr:FAD-dependent pyridine nucleotide-disulfide oxidoreductase [Paragonimus heterotremus]